jgi:hypothetical protein
MCRGKRCVGTWASGTSPLLVTRDVAPGALAQVPAQRLSDQDTMLPYRMTPPVRGRRPAPRLAERTTLASGSGGKGARSKPSLLRSAPLPQRSYGLQSNLRLGDS